MVYSLVHLAGCMASGTWSNKDMVSTVVSSKHLSVMVNHSVEMDSEGGNSFEEFDNFRLSSGRKWSSMWRKRNHFEVRLGRKIWLYLR